MKRIDQIDPNFSLQGVIPQDYLFHSPHDGPFRIWGLVPNDQCSLCRLPLEQLPRMSDGVNNLSWHLAGGIIRFATDSPGLGLVWKLKGAGVMPHFTACGQSGLELYEETDGCSRHVKNFLPLMNEGCGCKLMQTSYTDLPGGLRSYALYLPLYNGLDELMIALAPGATLMPGRSPAISRPVVFYGSSITQPLPGLDHAGKINLTPSCIRAMESQRESRTAAAFPIFRPSSSFFQKTVDIFSKRCIISFAG